jgi:hypothetical protein
MQDTFVLTEELLKANGYFGMLEEQVAPRKQEKG